MDPCALNVIRSSWFGGATSTPLVPTGTTRLGSKKKKNASLVERKEPRPQRTLLVVNAAVRGIKDAIRVTEKDIDEFQSHKQFVQVSSS